MYIAPGSMRPGPGWVWYPQIEQLQLTNEPGQKAGEIGIDLCDPSTFEASRLMYWPSCCTDSTYVYQYGDKPSWMLTASWAYTDWRNVTEWPQVPGAQRDATKLAAKQGEPTKSPVLWVPLPDH